MKQRKYRPNFYILLKYFFTNHHTKQYHLYDILYLSSLNYRQNYNLFIVQQMVGKKYTSYSENQSIYLEDSKIYMSELKHFLETFKTNKCQNNEIHNLRFCSGYHSLEDKRRNPYSQHTFLYNIQKGCICADHLPQLCNKSQNDFQSLYHPLSYKIQPCSNQFNCSLGFFCPYLHSDEKIYFQYGEFFRFDIEKFKTKLCKRRDQHQRTVCNYYHNQLDRRRLCFSKYDHVLCSNPKNCQLGQACSNSHNKIQQLYHPSRYKSKFCHTYSKNPQACQYRQFCSFAHKVQEIRVKIIHTQRLDAEFHMYLYKTVWCPFTQSHERSACVYAHNFQDFRRNPKEKKYKAQKCPYWDFKSDDIKNIQQAGCKYEMQCDKCHGWMQFRYHPANYNKKNKSNKRQEEHIKNNMIKHPLSQKKSSKISTQEKVNPSVGAPFFQKQRENSQNSRQTKAKTVNVSSDISNQDGASLKDDNFKSQKMSQKPKFVNFFQDQPIWKNERGTTLGEVGVQLQFRAKSLGKQKIQIDYSQSIKDMLQASILSKLRNNKLNQVKIINLSQQQIKKLKFLSDQQKDMLSRKITQYSLKRDLQSIQYSHQLTKFFVKRKCDKILQKMRSKKVKEDKLLKLLPKEIQQFSFLDSCQKGELPKILKEFGSDKEFEEINKMIKQSVSLTQHT